MVESTTSAVTAGLVILLWIVATKLGKFDAPAPSLSLSPEAAKVMAVLDRMTVAECKVEFKVNGGGAASGALVIYDDKDSWMQGRLRYMRVDDKKLDMLLPKKDCKVVEKRAWEVLDRLLAEKKEIDKRETFAKL